MKRKRHKIILSIALFISVITVRCSESSGIYIDINKGAIVSCDGIGIKEIKIENDSSEVTLQGTPSIIYFNKKNLVSRTSIYGDVVNNYELKLKRNCIYKITKYMGSDRGNFIITFKTDSSGKVIKASDINCN